MKRYTITGSLGNISKPIAEGLIKAGKEVTIITSSASKTAEIEALGAKALVGSLNDGEFVKQAFSNAEVVYTMIPPIWQTSDWKASQLVIANNYTAAIKASKIQYVVNLSSIGAHLGTGCGPVDAVHDFEQMLNKIEGLNVKHLRPSYFYYNLLNLAGLVKHVGIMGGNFGTEGEKIALVHTDDIAAAALEELLALDFKGNSVRYIFSDFRTMQDVVEVLGKSIGKQFPWVVFSDDEQRKGLEQGGLPPSHVEPFTTMGIALREGRMQEKIVNEKPTGKVKLEDFAPEFAKAYNAQA